MMEFRHLTCYLLHRRPTREPLCKFYSCLSMTLPKVHGEHYAVLKRHLSETLFIKATSKFITGRFLT